MSHGLHMPTTIYPLFENALRAHYDWVLIDTPPLLAMADAPVLCSLVDGVVLVLAAEVTTMLHGESGLRQAVRAHDFAVTLLDGVTGSGKTEVYLEAVAEALAGTLKTEAVEMAALAL